MYKLSKKIELGSLYQRQKKAEQSRKALQAQENLRYMISVDRMERMDLIAINNRCLFKFNKIKRAQQISNRYAKKIPFLPTVDKLKLQSKLSSSPAIKNQLACQSQPQKTKQQANEQKLYQQLIDEYLDRVKDSKPIDTLASQNEIVEQACREIFKKIEERRCQLRLSTVNKRRKTQGTERSSSMKPTKPSISDYQFQQNIERINKAKYYGEKVRNMKEKMFLRKLRTLKQIAKRSR